MLKDVRLLPISSFLPSTVPLSPPIPTAPILLPLFCAIFPSNLSPPSLALIPSQFQHPTQITSAIGVEIRDSSQLAESMNESFDTTQRRLKGTMNRMLRMAERTGVGWKVWVLFFVAVWGVFGWVWLV